MTNLTEYTTEQLKGQHRSLMTSIMIIGQDLKETDVLYDNAIEITNEIEKREAADSYKTDIMFL